MYTKKRDEKGGRRDVKGGEGGREAEAAATTVKEFNELDWDIKKIRKDIEFLGSPFMTWKERKDLENKKVVSLGGKPPKKQRLPLSVARAVMKNQKKRVEKVLIENPLLARLGGRNTKQTVDRRKPEDSVLRSSEGNFRNGVLDVKNLLRSAASTDTDHMKPPPSKGWQKKGGKNKKNHGKNKGCGRKRH
ncbi:hypothetical protein Droror1_Dr00001660 [Drosera rotundifolia]